MELNLTDSNRNSSRHFEQLTEFLKTYISDIRIKEEHGDQITYIILDDTEHTKLFPKMLIDLEENKTKYHIKSYGLSNSSLEQVFLRVADEIKRPEDYERLSFWKKLKNRIKKCFGKEEKEENNDETNEEENNNDQQEFNTSLSGKIKNQNHLNIYISKSLFVLDEWSSYTTERYTNIRYLSIQIIGLLIKRFHRTKRNIKGLIAEFLLPIIFVFLAMLVTKLSSNQNEPPSLILHPWYWGKTNYIFQSISINKSSLLSKSIQQTFTQSPSLGTRCMKTTMLDKQLYPCDSINTGYVYVPTSLEVINALNNVNYNQTRISPECDCYEKMQTCPIGAGGLLPSYDRTETKDFLYRLDGFNITDWFVE
jgi:hypothetical protein